MNALLLGMLVVVALAGCGGGGTSSTVARHQAPPTQLELEELEEDFTPRPPPHPQRLARPCGPEQLVVTHEGGAGGAMSTYHTRFTLFNLSERACSISGYPKLFALRIGGRVAEGPADHGTGAYEASDGPINIVGRGQAAFEASWSADVLPEGKCGTRIVAGYRVLLPGSQLAQTVPYPNFDHCAGGFSVGRIEPAPEGRLPSQPREEATPSGRLPRCDPADLVVWQGIDYPGGAAAGTSYGHLEVTNLSERSCELSGIPHMVAVDLRGRPLGPPVGRSASMPTIDGGPPVRVARLNPHGSALFTFSVGEVLNYGTHGCDYEYAAGFDVTLPGAAHPQYVPAPTQRCLRPELRKQVSVGPIE